MLHQLYISWYSVTSCVFTNNKVTMNNSDQVQH